MSDPMDDLIRAASESAPNPAGQKPAGQKRRRTGPALAVLLALAALLLALPILLAVTGQAEDALINLGFGGAGLVLEGGR